MATKYVEHIPSTVFSNDAFVDPLKRVTSMKEKDASRMTGGNIDFNTNIKNDVISGSPKSKKVFI